MSDDAAWRASVRKAERMAYVATVVQSLALIAMAWDGEWSAVLCLAVALGLTVWSVVRLRRMRRAR